MKKLFIVLFYLIYISTYAQVDNSTVRKDGTIPGYIINKQNEYKAGFLVVSNDEANSEYVDFLKFRKAPKERLTKNNISGYGYNNIIYELMPYKNDSVFLQRLNKQEPYLYYYKGKEIKEFYIKKEEELCLLPENRSKLVSELKSTYNNCDAVLDQMEYATYNKNRLSNILIFYNDCSNKKLPYFKVGILSGYMFNNIKFSNSSIRSYYESGPIISVTDPSFEQRCGYGLGIYFDALFLENKYNWTLHSEIEFSKVKYDFIGKATIVNFWDYSDLINKDLDLEMNYYNANIFFRYNSLRKKVSIYTDFGPVISYIKENSKIDKTEIDFHLNNFMIGFGTGIGIDYPIFSRFNLNIGLKGNYLLPAGGEEYEKFRVWNWGLALGIGI